MSEPVPMSDIPRLWAPERWLRIRYDVSRRELSSWRAKGLVKARVANQRKISVYVPDVEKVIERQIAGNRTGRAPVPKPAQEELRRRREGGMPR